MGPPRDRSALRSRARPPGRRNLVRAASRPRARRHGQISVHDRAAVDPGPSRRRDRPRSAAIRAARTNAGSCSMPPMMPSSASARCARSSPDEVMAAARDGSIVDLMDWRRPVQNGDFIYNPAGTIHALGPGLTVLEIQQAVDLTYRLYDYGRPRELHLDEAADVVEPRPHRHRLDAQVGDAQPAAGRRPAFRSGLVRRNAARAAGTRCATSSCCRSTRRLAGIGSGRMRAGRRG